MGTGSKLALGGCIGLILLGLLTVGGCFALVANVESSADSESGASKEEAKKEVPAKKKEKNKKKEDQNTTVATGQPVTAGDIEWTVTNARRANELRQENFGQIGEGKQGNLVVVDLLFTNNGNEPSTLSTNSLTLLDSSNRESRSDKDTFGYIENDRNIFLEQVNPGVAQEGTVLFTVAPDAAGFRLQVGDANMFSNEEAYVDLGF